MEAASTNDPDSLFWDHSEVPDVLQVLFNRSIAELFLTSKVACATLGSESARLKPEGSPPRPTVDPADEFYKSWSRAVNNVQRLKVIKSLQDAVVRVKYSPKVKGLEGTIDWKIAVARDARPAPVVAELFGISSSYVRTLRSRYKS